MLLTVERSYVGNYVTRSTLLDRACGCARVPTKIFLNIVPTALVTQHPGANKIDFYTKIAHREKIIQQLPRITSAVVVQQ